MSALFSTQIASHAEPIHTPIVGLLLSTTEFHLPGSWDRRHYNGNQIETIGRQGGLKLDQHFTFTPPSCNPFDLPTLIFLQQYVNNSEEALFTNRTTNRKISVSLTPNNLDGEPRFNQLYTKVSSCNHFTITQDYPNNSGKVWIYGSYTFLPRPNIPQTGHPHLRAFRLTTHELVTKYLPDNKTTRTDRRLSIMTYTALLRETWITVGEEIAPQQDIIDITPIFQNQIHKVLIAR